MQKELKLAGNTETLKQDLHFSYDYNLDSLYQEIDDCNMKFIDTSNLKRFLVKCGLFVSNATLIAIIRRMDLDADARLTQKEFFDGIMPLERQFTKSSAAKSIHEMKRKSKKSTASRKQSANGSRYGNYSILANTLHGSALHERDFL